MNSNKTKGKGKKESNSKKIITGILLLALVIAAYFLFFDKNKAEQTANINTTQNSAEDKKNDPLKNSPVIPRNVTSHFGKYISQSCSECYRELKSDSTFYAKDGPLKGGGTYRVDSNVITFKYEVGMEAQSYLIGDMIVDSDKEVWKLEK